MFYFSLSKVQWAAWILEEQNLYIVSFLKCDAKYCRNEKDTQYNKTDMHQHARCTHQNTAFAIWEPTKNPMKLKIYLQ